MATRSLGALTLDLVLKMGGFEQGLSQAERQTLNFQRATDNFANAASKAVQRFSDQSSRDLMDLEKTLKSVDKAFDRLEKQNPDGAKEQLQQYQTLRDSLVRMREETLASAQDISIQTDAFRRLERTLDPVGSKLKMLAQQQQELDNARSSNIVGQDRYNQLSKSISDQVAQLDGTAAAQQELQRSTEEAQRQFQQLARSLDPISAKLDDIAQSEKRLNAALRRGDIDRQQFDQYSRALSEQRHQLDGTAASERALADATASLEREYQSLASSLNPVETQLERIAEQRRILANANSAGLIGSTEVFQNQVRQLDQMEAALKRTKTATDQYVMSERQMAAAMRGLPAQFTDIVVSLQGGQKPLTVLLQQGGQIKDMFGGVGGAARAVSSSLMRMVNPYTLLAGAIGAVGIAIYKHTQDIADYNKSLALTNNFAQTTGGELEQLSQQLQAQGDSYSTVQQAISQMVSDGTYGYGQIASAADSVAKMNRATGQSVKDLIAQYDQIQKDPLQGLLNLDKQYHFLNVDQVKHIAHLEQIGKQQQAVTDAMDIWAKASDKASQRVMNNLSAIDRLMNNLKNLWQKAWGALSKEANDGASILMGAFGSHNLNDQIALRTASSQDSVRSWLLTGHSSEYNRNIANILQGVKAFNQMQQAAEGASAATNSINAQKVGAQLHSQLNHHSTPHVRAYTDDAATRELQSLREQTASLREQLKGNTQLTQQQQDLVKFNQQIADLKEKHILTADQKSLLANQNAIRSQLQLNAALSIEIRRREDTQKLIQARQRLVDSVATPEEKAISTAKQRYTELGRIQANPQAMMSQRDADRVRQNIFNTSFTKAPNVGTDQTFAGRQDKYREQEESLNKWYNTQMDQLNEFRKLRLGTIDQWNQKEAQLNSTYRDQNAKLQRQMLDDQLSNYSNIYGGMADVVGEFFGKQNALYKTAFLASKSFAIAEALINAPKAASDAYSAMAPIPFVGPALGVAAAAAAVTAQLGYAAQIRSVGISGMAHSGIDSVPEDGTWLLQRGERVTTAQTSAKLDATLSRIDRNKINGSSNNVNIYNTNGSRVRQQRQSNGDLAIMIDNDFEQGGPISQTLLTRMQTGRRLK